MSLAYIYHSDCQKHAMGEGHPEQPGRIEAIHQALQQSNLMQKLTEITPCPAKPEQLKQAHKPEYVDHVFATAPTEGMVALDPDTCMNKYSLQAALLAAGAVVQAVDLVMDGTHKRAFCNVRPPGHHAVYGQAMGFCFFNNIAVGALHALNQHQLERVAIVDFDVHHGNGTEAIFHEDQRVLLCSSFQHPFYPFSGDNSGNKHIINTPLPAGAGSSQFRAVVNDVWLPNLINFQPQLIFISAGFDAHKSDPIGGLCLDEADFAWVTEQLAEVANQLCDGKVVSSLEGGYNLQALASSAVAHVAALVR